MTILAKKWFSEKDGSEPELAKQLVVASFGVGVAENLKVHIWDGKPITAIGLKFSP